MVVDLAQALGVDVAVHLRGRERGVAEQLLDRAQVGAALEQMRRERVPEPMRVRDEPAERRRVEPAAARREEQRVLGAAGELRPRLAEVARDEVRGLLAERDDAVLRALALADVDELLLEVDVAEVERRPPRRCAARPSRRARRARGFATASGPSPLERVDDRRRPRAASARRAGAAAGAGANGASGTRSAPSVKRSSARTAASLREIVAGASSPAGPRRGRARRPSRRARARRSSSIGLSAVPAAELAQVGGVGAPRRRRRCPRRRESARWRLRSSLRPMFAPRLGSPAGGLTAWQRLAELAVHGANVQPGQVVLVTRRARPGGAGARGRGGGVRRAARSSSTSSTSTRT